MRMMQHEGGEVETQPRCGLEHARGAVYGALTSLCDRVIFRYV